MTLRHVYCCLNKMISMSSTAVFTRSPTTVARLHLPALTSIRSLEFRSYSSEDPGSAKNELIEKRDHTVDEILSNSTESSVSYSTIEESSSNLDSPQLPDKLYKSIELELLAYEPAVLDSYEWFLLTAASHLGIEVGPVLTPRKSDKFRFPLLKSAHVHKKHKVHYEVRTYHKFITLKKLTGSTASTYLEYIQRNIPEGIGMKVSKLEVLPKPDYILALEPTSTTT